jgi:hypothetical protein
MFLISVPMPRTKGKPATSATPSKVAEAKVKKSRTAKTIFMDETRKKHKGSESEKELKAKWAKLWKELSKAEKTVCTKPWYIFSLYPRSTPCWPSAKRRQVEVLRRRRKSRKTQTCPRDHLLLFKSIKRSNWL